MSVSINGQVAVFLMLSSRFESEHRCLPSMVAYLNRPNAINKWLRTGLDGLGALKGSQHAGIVEQTRRLSSKQVAMVQLHLPVP